MDTSEVVNGQAVRRAGRESLGARVVIAIAAAMLGVCTPALAQDAEDGLGLGDDDTNAPPEPGTGADATSAGQGSAEADGASSETPSEPSKAGDAAEASGEISTTIDTGAEPAGPPDPEQRNGFVKPQSENELSWAGGLELDTGYAQYTFESSALHDEEVYDFRGRFVFGPTLEHAFGEDWFLAVRGEAVLWVREQFGVYQVNVDDAFAQLGKRNVWDFKLGRFRTWRVYHKGLGFDLFTLEDAGACVQNPCSADAGTFGPHTYEVNFIYERETPGHAAVHVYPTPWSGLELAAAYGQGGVSNSWGVRGTTDIYTVTTGAFDEGGSNDTTSLGGYAEFDFGSLAFDRSLILGFGLNRTEALAVNENFRQHTQYAAYIAYPLGFNAAMVKLVLSRSDLQNMTLVDEMNRVFNESNSAMSSARLRFAYPF
jgi:hypothetical protein